MKRIASVIIAVVMLVLCFTLSACGNKYTSHYNSKLMVMTNTSTEASVSFDSFDGVYVIKFNNVGSDKVFISYYASLEEGNIKVYYDFDDEKLDLFEIGTDGSLEGKTEEFTSNRTIYIVIESNGQCGVGSFSFALEKSSK